MAVTKGSAVCRVQPAAYSHDNRRYSPFSLFPPSRISIFVKLGDECSQSFCSAERREASKVTMHLHARQHSVGIPSCWNGGEITGDLSLGARARRATQVGAGEVASPSSKLHQARSFVARHSSPQLASSRRAHNELSHRQRALEWFTFFPHPPRPT